MLEKGFMIADRYRIIEKIGAGGMAIVYKARCQKLERDVAIKVLREEYLENEQFVRKFKSEAVKASRLSHPNIINIYDVGFEKDNYYIVMEYVKGNTFKKLIDGAREIDFVRAMGIILKTAEALNSAHKEGIIHRDIKTQNIIITEDGIVKVADFGISTATTTSTLSVTSNAIGSVHYFSPEQAKGEIVDIRSDIYSLGIVMFEAFTKRLPFEGDSPVAVALKQVTEEVPQPSKFNGKISLNLDRIILKCTNKNPNDRYPNLTELIKDLQDEFDYIVRVEKNEGNENRVDGAESENIKSSWAVVNIKRKKDAIEEVAATTETEKASVPVTIESYEIQKEQVETKIDIVEVELMNIKQNEKNEEEVKIEQANQPEKEEDSEEEKAAMRALRGDNDSKGDKIIYISAVLTALVIISVISFFGFTFIQGFQNSLILDAPDFVGKYFKDAQEEANEKGIKLNKTKEIFTDNVKEGAVVEQSYKPGQKIQKNGTIDIIVSKGSEMLTVPDVVGEDYNKVKANLEEQGFNVKIETVSDPNKAAGIIISQDPSEGTEMKKLDKFVLSIGLGKELSDVAVPNVTNISEALAKKTLQDSRLKVGSIKYEASTKIIKGNVISQSIKAGTKVEQDAGVDLVVSNGGTKESATSIFKANGNETDDTKTTPATTDKQTNKLPVQTVETSLKSLVLEIKPVEPMEKAQVPVMITRTSGTKLNLLYNRECLKSEFPFKYKAEGNVGDIIKVYIDGKVQIEDVIK